MGFDPRRWQPAPGSPAVTTNIPALLAENEALRREVRALRLQLEQLQRGQRQRERPLGTHGLSPARVERWVGAMACHPRWSQVRIGPPGGLRALVEEQRSRWWNPRLSLEQELDRRAPGLGSELAEALRGPHSRGRWAVRAAFALYGQRAPEWLDDEPLRVVEALWGRIGQRPPRRPGTRTANHSTAHHSSTHNGRADNRGPQQHSSQQRRRPNRGPVDPRSAALALLGLEAGASPQAIKRAYRHLAKAHHPDLGGDVEAFRRLDAAYRLLIG